MSVPRKGWRPITVDGTAFLWRIPKPTYWESAFGGMALAVVHASGDGAILRVRLKRNRPDAWVEPDDSSITPRTVRRFILAALSQGWQPEEPGPTLELNGDEEAAS